MQTPEQLHKFSPRDGLKAGVIMVGAGALAYLRLWGLSVPGPSEETVALPFKPGWLETRNPGGPPFISGDHQRGHRDYLRFMTRDPLLTNILHEAFSDLMKPREERPTIAETFETHVRYAAKRLYPAGGELEDAIHVAFFTMAAVYNDLFTREYIYNHFHAIIPPAACTDDNTYWMKDFIGHTPKIFAVDRGTEHGLDKVFHFANFAFITHEYWYATHYGLTEAGRIPNAAKLFASTAPDEKKGANRLSRLGEFVWEYYETIEWLRSGFETGSLIWPPTVGVLDPDVGGDFRANKLGRIVALQFAREEVSNRLYKNTLLQLQNPENLVSLYDPK